jgi:hypothetical protein
MLTITPVVEIPFIEEGDSWPWPVSPCKPFTFLPLDAASPESAGTFMAALYGYYGKDHARSVDGLLVALRDTDGMCAPGGLLAANGELVVSPGCCCGIESWTEWRHFLETGASPWMGHDPWPYAERVDGNVLLWSDKSDREAGEGVPPVKATVAEFESALTAAETQVRSFFAALPQWFESMQRADATDVIERIQESFLNH